MKLIIGILTLFTSPFLIGQDADIVSAFKESNANLLSPVLSESVWICIDEHEDEYTKKEAVMRLSQFMKSEHIDDFKLIHSNQPGNASSTKVIIGEVMGGNLSFRLSAYINKNTHKLDEIRILRL